MSKAGQATMCQLYRAQLKKLRETVPCVTAGRLADAMGVSRTTAKKYLEMNVHLGYLQPYDFIHVNGQNATAYTFVKRSS